MFLGGGFKYISCSPLPGEMIQFDQYFLNGLKPPTRSNIIHILYPCLTVLARASPKIRQKKTWKFWAAFEVIGAHQDESQASEIAKKDHLGPWLFGVYRG